MTEYLQYLFMASNPPFVLARPRFSVFRREPRYSK